MADMVTPEQHKALQMISAWHRMKKQVTTPPVTDEIQKSWRAVNRWLDEHEKSEASPEATPRNLTRVQLNLMATCYGSSGLRHVEVFDISAGGMYVIDSCPVKPGERLAITVQVEGHWYGFEGRVSWLQHGVSASRQMGYGIRFL